MQLIDSHCHFDFAVFETKRDQLWQQAQQVGVEQLIIPTIGKCNFTRVQSLCQSNPNWHPAYALHPLFQHQTQDLVTLESYLARDAIALGECGLDYYVKPLDKATQQSYFAAQLELAVTYRLPVIIHARKAMQDIILSLRQYPSLCGVVHSFSGSLQQAEQLLNMGFKLGIGGPISYPRATRLQALVKNLPLSAWLLETDAPDQPLCGYQGQTNHPAQVRQVLTHITAFRSESLEDLAYVFYQNTCTLFQLKPSKLE